MSNARLQKAVRHVECGEVLVEDQRRRVADAERRENPAEVERTAELLAILEHSLGLHRQSLERLKRDLNIRHNDPNP